MTNHCDNLVNQSEHENYKELYEKFNSAFETYQNKDKVLFTFPAKIRNKFGDIFLGSFPKDITSVHNCYSCLSVLNKVVSIF
jgi:hypothetical protein